VLQKAVYAGTQSPSFARASEALGELAGLDISAKQVERLCRRIGEERCAERDAQVDAYRKLPLAERKAVPPGAEAPGLAVVQMDGGRLQILDRKAAAAAPTPGAAAPVAPAAPGSHWREDKVGLLAAMAGEVAEADPCPTIPGHFVDPRRIAKLAREIKGSGGGGVPDAAPGAEVPGDAAPGSAEIPTPYEAPTLEVRSVVATRADVHGFGGILAQAAWERGFFGAERRAFVADGSSANWGVWERHFASFTPVVDFIHALTYVYAAAMAGRPFEAGWAAYTRWIGRVWAGDVEAVIAALEARQAEVGCPAEGDPETAPSQRVAETLTYLRNQKERMRYAEYRRQGLPITSGHVESTIKRINQRVKGTEKFWSEDGAEAILQLRADALSETCPLEAFWQRRQEGATGQRCYSSKV
jgi:hypothetical protein